MSRIIKRNGEIVPFQREKIENAILKAMKYGSGIYKPDIASLIAKEVEQKVKIDPDFCTVYQIENEVYFSLLDYDEELTAKSYEGYRAVQAFKRKDNTTDSSVLSLLNRENEEVMKENSNKNGILVSTQRDLVAGEISKDIARRKLIPAHIVQAHDDGVLHWHDMDYTMQQMFNCCLINIKDMLDNGTVINGKMVESPNSFQTACTIMTQIIAQVASSQYGGQSVNIKHLGKYLAKSRTRYEKLLSPIISDKDLLKNSVDVLVQKELEAGVQTIQYQINTLMTTNGQAPFVTLFLHIEEGDEYEEEIAAIVYEILKQRIKGIKNEKGVYVTPAFPKLIYVLDEHNCLDGGKYDYITKQAAATCTIKRMYPDYISAKKMKENYELNLFSPINLKTVSK